MSKCDFQLDVNNNYITKLTFNSTFQNGDIIEIPTAVPGAGDGDTIEVVGLPVGFTFGLSLPVTTTTFDIKSIAFKDLAIQEFNFRSAVVTFNASSFEGSKLKQITLKSTYVFQGINIFKNCLDLKLLTLESGITDINESMFYGCDSLGTVTIPQTVATIGKEAFKNTVISSLIFENAGSVALTIGVGAFESSIFPQLNLPSRTVMVSKDAFNGCKKLTELKIPAFSGVCVFGSSVFQDCVSLQSLEMNGRVDEEGGSQYAVGIQLCQGCLSLRQVQFYQDIENISQSAFNGCTKLNKIIFDAESTSEVTLGSGCFTGCGFDYLKLPALVTVLNDNCFQDCLLLKQVVIDAQTPIIDVAKAFLGCITFEQLILGYKFTTFPTPPSSAPGFMLYVYTQIAYNQLVQNYNNLFIDKVILKPYCNRKFVNHKAIYQNENDVSYVMYTLPSSNNLFNDCTFYFRDQSSTSSVIVITASDDGIMKNCVKMFAATADMEGKTIQKIYYENTPIKQGWYAQSTNGLVKRVEDLTPEYILQSNFVCEQVYNGSTILTLDGSNLITCDMYDLNNLTVNNKVYITGIKRVKLTSNKNNRLQDIVINIGDSAASPVFEVNDLECRSLTIHGDNCKLFLENTVKDRSQQWVINAENIIINTLWVDYTVFQGQKIDEETPVQLTQVACVKEVDDVYHEPLIKFTANKTITFQLIQNKNDLILHPDTTDINAVYYSSGWTM